MQRKITLSRLSGLGIFSLLALMPAAAMADEQARWIDWGIGIAASSSDRPYIDYKRDNKVVPVLYAQNRWFSLSGGRADFRINPSETLSFRLRARYSLDGYDPKDSPALIGMAERKDGVWLGGAVEWSPGIADFSLEYLTDATDKSGGSRARFAVDRRFGWGKFGLTPRLEAEWLDDKYVDYYYGVLPGEAAPGRVAYQGTATTKFGVGLRADYTLGRRHNLFLDVAYDSFGSQVKDSPIVEDAAQTRFTVGYMVRF